MAEDEINFAGKTIRLDVKMVVSAIGAIIAFILWLSSISNKLDLLALQVATQAENRYTSNDAKHDLDTVKRDFDTRDERFDNLKAQVLALTQQVKLNDAKLAAIELPEDRRKIYSNKVP